MNEYVMRHIMDAANARMLVPGDSFPGLTSATAGTFMLSDDMKIAQVLLETAAGESIEEAADFFLDMLTIAADPRKSTSDAMTGTKASGTPIIARLFIGSLLPEGQKYIRDRIAGVVATTEVGFQE